VLRRASTRRAERAFSELHERFRSAEDAPGVAGVLVNAGIAAEWSGDVERAAELLHRGAMTWERHNWGHIPSWAWLATADALFAAGRLERASLCVARAEHWFGATGESRGLRLCRAHPARKPVLSERKAGSG
jgi:hypothetical protein